ncbi:YqaA family protein [Usitatibacter palustris]|uniref:Inner membrane protein YqaA n=1 Tax=Usitatibacter palustris TaxID=2732487 RepID=A0A6M4HE53_9PROT|nr:YqaA family protein [Usitatibacter palustris]QJR16894.1 Inner membrane protein YqaA [Usitatibacter palustris]
MPDWSADTGLASLFISAFVSATILPGNSEIVLVAVLKSFPGSAATAVLVATLGNTLGGFTTYLLGRLVPKRLPKGRALAWVERYGAAALLLSWVPLIGDALCAAAGWLRVSWGWSLAAMALGKFARYVLIAQAVALV